MDINNNNNSNNNSNNDNINGLKLLESNSNRLLNIILKSQIGVSEIQLKRKVTELSLNTELLKKLQIEKSNIINQIQIESNRLKYLESLDKNKLLKSSNKNISNNNNNNNNNNKNGNKNSDSSIKNQQRLDNNDKEEEQVIENQLLESICSLKEQLFNLSTSRSVEQNLFNRIYQSKLIEHLKSNSSQSKDNNITSTNTTNITNGSFDNNKIIKLSKIRDETIERCLKLTNQIDLNNNQILDIRKQRTEEMKTNREIYSSLKLKLEESRSKTEKEQRKYEILKDKTNLLGFIIQSLIYESGIDWVQDEEIVQFFDTLDKIGEDIELD